jgi:hypothetical protein
MIPRHLLQKAILMVSRALKKSSHFPFYEEKDKFIIELVAIKNEIERLAKRSCEEGDHSA